MASSLTRSLNRRARSCASHTIAWISPTEMSTFRVAFTIACAPRSLAPASIMAVRTARSTRFRSTATTFCLLALAVRPDERNSSVKTSSTCFLKR